MLLQLVLGTLYASCVTPLGEDSWKFVSGSFQTLPMHLFHSLILLHYKSLPCMELYAESCTRGLKHLWHRPPHSLLKVSTWLIRRALGQGVGIVACWKEHMRWCWKTSNHHQSTQGYYYCVAFSIIRFGYCHESDIILYTKIQLFTLQVVLGLVLHIGLSKNIYLSSGLSLLESEWGRNRDGNSVSSIFHIALGYFLSLVQWIEPRGALSPRYIPNPFCFLRQGLAGLPRLASNFQPPASPPE